MCDVQTVAMKLLLITDRPAAVKTVVLKVTDCTHRAFLNYFMQIFYNSIVVVLVAAAAIVVAAVAVVVQQLQQL